MDTLMTGARKMGVSLSPEQIEKFEVFFHELVTWNTRINLTAITDYHDVQIKHFLDSLTLTMAFDDNLTGASCRLIDIGSGAGLPGLPLAIAFPTMKITLLEATGKKTTFLKHMVDALGLTNVDIINARAEEAAHDAKHREYYDIVTARAVADMTVLMELLLPFCKSGGVAVIPKKGDISIEVRLSGYALSVLGGKLEAMIPVKLEELSDERVVIRIRKTDRTPTLYPRRTGMPGKRPLFGTDN